MGKAAWGRGLEAGEVDTTERPGGHRNHPVDHGGLGLADSREKFVPIDGARIDQHDVFVAYSHDTIKDSPSPAAADGLTPEEEAELRRYYRTER